MCKSFYLVIDEMFDKIKQLCHKVVEWVTKSQLKQQLCDKDNELSHLKEELQGYKNELKVLKQQDEQYKLVYDYVFSIREDILKRDEVLAQVYDSPNTFKEAMVDLLDWLKHDFTVRTAKVTDNVLHIAYRNG
jgi:cell shape-determining protein MreC